MLVAQLDRVSASEAEGRGFDSPLKLINHLIKTLDNASVFVLVLSSILAIIINLLPISIIISIWVFDKGDVFHRTPFRTLFKFYAYFHQTKRPLLSKLGNAKTDMTKASWFTIAIMIAKNLPDFSVP